MRVVPPEPRVKGAVDGVRVKLVDAEWGREDDLRDGEEHEAEIATDCHAAPVLRHHFAELDAMSKESEQRQDCE